MSIKFPSLYKVAAQLLQKASEEDINVKHILYNNRKYRHHNIKSIYAVVTKALQNWDAIECLLKESNILKEHTGLDVWRIRVVISEVVFNQKEFPNPENYTLKTVIDYEEKFKKILSKKQTKALIGSNVNSETDVTKVRFIKINLIKDDVNSVIEAFIEEGWQKLKTASNYQDYLQQLKDLEPSSSVFLQDFHFPEVLAFPPRTELQFHELYTNGSVFFMDKSSCLAPFLVAPERNSEVLDMCAAPGLKTVQLASYVTSGKVYAVEKDEERYDSLEKMVERSGADNVITILKDVTTLKTDKYKHVEYILVDPSCSGSGIRKRQPSTSSKDRMDEKTRIEKLSGFQVTLLRFAFTKFPAAKRVVYSTCSLNVEENEQVVESALNSYNHNFNIVSVQDKLSEWQNFGSKEFQFGNKCIYCKPEIDQTNGFFVAIFERDESKRNNLCFSSQTGSGKSVNRVKGKKRTIHEENFNNESNYAKVPPIKRHKLNKVPSERKEENQVVSTKSGDVSDQQKTNTKSTKESLSEKKRSRKRRLKLKRKVFPDSQKHKKLKVKVKHNGSNNVIEKQDSTLCVEENSNRISKAKLRHNRKKKMKLNSSLGSVASNEASNSLNVEDNTDDKSKLKKRKNIVNSLQENASGLSEIENKKVAKNKKKEQIFTVLNENETVKVKPIDSSKHLVEISSKNDQNHSVVLHKHKHKKRQVLEESVCIADAGDKMEEEIHVKGKVKKKHKKSHEKDNSENACTADAGDKLEEEIHVKSKHKKKHKENHETDNSENVCTANAGDKLEEEIRVKSKHKKKHKVNHEKENLENDSRVADVGDKLEEEIHVKSKHKKKHKEKQKEESLENVCVANAGDKLEEEIHFKSKHKKKHKENHEKENLENACIADIGDKLEEEMLRYDVKNKHKKKHKKQHEETLEMFN